MSNVAQETAWSGWRAFYERRRELYAELRKADPSQRLVLLAELRLLEDQARPIGLLELARFRRPQAEVAAAESAPPIRSRSTPVSHPRESRPAPSAASSASTDVVGDGADPPPESRLHVRTWTACARRGGRCAMCRSSYAPGDRVIVVASEHDWGGLVHALAHLECPVRLRTPRRAA